MTVGIVGAGQLGRMLALAGYPLGQDFLFLDRTDDTPGAKVAPSLRGEFTDRRLLRELARRSEVITFDWENVSVESLAALGRRTRIAPPLAALAASQDRLSEKRLFDRLGIPTTRYAAVDSRASLLRAVKRIGLPGVLKTRRMGYDGKGQSVLRRLDDLDAALATMGGQPAIYEEFVPFDFEVSIIGARSTRGEVAIYPLNGNVHRDGILRVTRSPHGTAALQRRAAGHLRRMLGHFDYAGILNIEFFVRRGRLVANETAPRVHNSGHWTIEGAETSQFENHLRAILGLPLGSTAARGHAAMVNLIGTMPGREALLAIPGLHLHDYAKAPRPGRKLGHCTLVAANPAARERRLRRLLRLVDRGA
ncbi:MAG: 5-(carboxyamino)imidazole ribonucleotide synthase [Steroidobacteraceae bacterium]|jgi:5-(carboxyamino)imidazole ribonucleotide synthase|nr:5-(carboxyamino)imidazole ribonucleotide synthase [Steroidobacteraceae bacterium]